MITIRRIKAGDRLVHRIAPAVFKSARAPTDGILIEGVAEYSIYLRAIDLKRFLDSDLEIVRIDPWREDS